ncbi:MAG: hypothetical protein ACE5L7_03910 [Candidatus Aminicenantales bacterium]
MKKVVFVLMIVSITSALHADGFKLMGGMNLWKYSAKAQEGAFAWSYKTGFCAGAGFEFDLTESQRMAVEIDALLVQKKGSYPEGGSSDVGWTYSLTTMRIPALARFKPRTTFPLYLLGGSELAIVLSHRLKERWVRTDSSGISRSSQGTSTWVLFLAAALN